jgi:broad specificity phosphatase PhoE
MSVLYLVRHGQASFGRSDYDRLSPLGERQSARLGSVLAERGLKPDLMVSGAMNRHRRTAELAMEASGFPGQAEIDAGYNEFDHDQIVLAHRPAYKRRAVMLADLGRTMQPARAFQEMFEEATRRWVTGDGTYAEPFGDFCARAEAAVRGTAQAVGKGETAVVFTSAGPIAAIVSRLLTGTDELWLKLNPVAVNTAVTKIVSGRRGLTVVSINDHSHLEGTDLLSYR